jgi:hypothetical protein
MNKLFFTLALIPLGLVACGGDTDEQISPASAPAAVAPVLKRIPKVLLVGIDGLQYEMLMDQNLAALGVDPKVSLKAQMPNLHSLNIYPAYVGGENGTDTQQETYSGPSWTTLLTGVWQNRHGVKNNNTILDNTIQASRVNTIFSQLEFSDSNKITASYAGWAFINNATLRNELMMIDKYDNGQGPDMDQSVFEKTMAAIQGDKAADLTFVHFNEPDDIGHAKGYCDTFCSEGSGPYRDGAAANDARLGKLLDVIKQRQKDRPEEDWLVMVVTDHGRDVVGGGSSHGLQSGFEKSSFIAMNKLANGHAKINKNPWSSNYDGLYGRATAADVAPTILDHFGILPPANKYAMDGVSLLGKETIKQLRVEPRYKDKSVEIMWQLEGIAPKKIEILRNGKSIATLAGAETRFIDANLLSSGELVKSTRVDYIVMADGVAVSRSLNYNAPSPAEFNLELLGKPSALYSFADNLVNKMDAAAPASVTGGASYAAGPNGKNALLLDSTSQKATIQDFLSGTDKFSVGFWFYQEKDAKYWRYVLADGSKLTQFDLAPVLTNKALSPTFYSNNRQGLGLFVFNGEMRLNLGNVSAANPTGSYVDVAVPLEMGKWQYIMLTGEGKSNNLTEKTGNYQLMVANPRTGAVRKATLAGFAPAMMANKTSSAAGAPAVDFTLGNDASGKFYDKLAPEVFPKQVLSELTIWKGRVMNEAQVAAIVQAGGPLANVK